MYIIHSHRIKYEGPGVGRVGPAPQRAEPAKKALSGGDGPCRRLLGVLMRSGTRAFPARIPDGDTPGSGATRQPLCGLPRVCKLSSRPPRAGAGLRMRQEEPPCRPQRQPHRSTGRRDRSQEGCQQPPMPQSCGADRGLMSSRGASPSSGSRAAHLAQNGLHPSEQQHA